MSDLDVIKKIEKFVSQTSGEKIVLEQVEKFEWSPRSYKIDKQGYITGISLSNCKIKDLSNLSECFKALKKLKTIDLSSNLLSNISHLQELITIEELYLHDNKFIDDIYSIAELKNLKVLDLSHNSIYDISPLRKLRKIKKLYLYYNPINDISALEEFTNIESLLLGETEIDDISALKNLKKIKELNLHGIGLICDISALKELINIKTLWLGENNIEDISPIQDLINIRDIDLSNNQINDIWALKRLKNITRLDLNSNYITNISVLSEFKKIETLDLTNNNIKILPKWICDFPKMNISLNDNYKDGFIFLNENPLESPPIEIVTQGKEAIKLWFANEDKIPVNEAKVLFVGEGASGKTSLIKQLMWKEFDKDEPQTRGIDINDLSVKVNYTDITLHLWDFGGQEYMHSTHQFFLSHRSLYVLVLDGRIDEKKYYWLRLIEAFGGNSPIVVVMNKIDRNPAFELNRSELLRKFPNIVGFFRLSCASRKGIDEFLEGLSKIAESLEMVKTSWVRKWFNIRNKLAEVTKNYISYSQFLSICKEENENDEHAQDVLLNYLDNLGVLLHFREFDLHDNHILNPHWVTNGVYRIINYTPIELAYGKMQLTWLREIFKKRTETDFDYPDEIQPFIVSLMKRFELCFALDSESVLVPDLFDVREPEIEIDKIKALKIIIQYEDFLPKSVLPRLVVKMHKHIATYWRTGIIFKNPTNDTRAVIFADEERFKLQIFIEGDYKRDYYTILRNNIYEISDNYNTAWVERIPCDCETCLSNGQPTLYEYVKLQKLLKYGVNDIRCENEPYKIVEIRRLIDDLLNHRPKDENLVLLNDILWAAKEIQQNHVSLHNDENRYNTEFRTILKAKNYTVEQESFIGESAGNGNQPGRLDLKISKVNRELALFEAFKIKSFGENGKNYAANHLLKLLKNYNPNGLKYCFAICYVEMNDFDKVWQLYKTSVKEFVFHYEIPKPIMQDLTDDFLKNITDIRVGLTEHSREGQLVKLFHVFMNMKF